MTTATWASVLDHSSDAGFRAWGAELSAKLAAVGMVKTADSGQINWAKATRPADTNTPAGHEIWKLNGGALFIRLEYGNGGATGAPSFWLTVGTGSDGSGALTGQQSARIQCGNADSVVPPNGERMHTSYLCATNSFLGLAWKLGGWDQANQAHAFIAVMRTVDAEGAANGNGYAVIASGQACDVDNRPTMHSQHVSVLKEKTAPVLSTLSCLVPGADVAPANSGDGSGNPQCFPWWHWVPGATPIQPLLHAASIVSTDVPVGGTFTAAVVGSTAHTYINASSGWPADSRAMRGIDIAMLFE